MKFPWRSKAPDSQHSSNYSVLIAPAATNGQPMVKLSNTGITAVLHYVCTCYNSVTWRFIAFNMTYIAFFINNVLITVNEWNKWITNVRKIYIIYRDSDSQSGQNKLTRQTSIETPDSTALSWWCIVTSDIKINIYTLVLSTPCPRWIYSVIIVKNTTMAALCNEINFLSVQTWSNNG